MTPTPEQTNLVLYHANCWDGFTAAWCAWLSLGDKAEYVPVFHGEPPPDVTGRHVTILDFAYRKPVLEQLVKKAASLVVLDHHRDKLDEWVGHDALRARRQIGGRENAYIVLEMEHSGARLSWDYFTGMIPLRPERSEVATIGYISTKKRPLLVDYVEDRDLWRWNLPHSREVSEALKIVPYDFAKWSEFAEELAQGSQRHDNWREGSFTVYLDGGFGRIVERGKTLLALTAQHLDLLAQTASRALLDGMPVWIANAPYIYASELGNLLARRGDPGVAAIWRYDHDKRRISVSLRSTDESGIDVSWIARAQGGGGHEHAAGFEVEVEDIGEIFELGPRR